jgi:MinD-like ATPase involved in chromosome partitioning or flagellar assembly
MTARDSWHGDGRTATPQDRAGESERSDAAGRVAQPDPLAGRRPSSDDLTAAELLRPRRPVPHSGWRAVLFRGSRGAVNPGPSAGELREEELLGRVRAAVEGCQRVAVISAKGGVGKTTTAATLGAALAAVRSDRVIAVDANPDLGTLAVRFDATHPSTVRSLLHHAEEVRSYADVRAFTAQGQSRLEVLASDSDPAVSDAFSESDYREAIDLLSRFYNLVVTDSGTGLLHSAMRGILGLASSLVVVAAPAVDGARSASATLDWLEAHEHRDLVRGAVVVISSVRPGSSEVNLDQLEQHFNRRCRAVVRIPFDPHLASGAAIELDRLHPATRDAYLLLAATVVDGLAQRRTA